MKFFSTLLALAAAAILCAACMQDPEPVTPLSLMNDLYAAYEAPDQERLRKVAHDVNVLGSPLLADAAENWRIMFIEDGYRLYLNGTDDPAALGIPDPSMHAFVVLGFCLNNGKMEPELEERCEAAAAVARAYPEALVICTGGATGANNPERHTEAGMMKDYLVRECGMDGARIIAEEDAMTTAENAVNAFRILRERGIRTVTVVTSSYHQRWGTLLFCAAAEWYREQGLPMEIIGNWCYDTAPSPGYDSVNARIAISQLRGLLLSGDGALLQTETEPVP